MRPSIAIVIISILSHVNIYAWEKEPKLDYLKNLPQKEDTKYFKKLKELLSDSEANQAYETYVEGTILLLKYSEIAKIDKSYLESKVRKAEQFLYNSSNYNLKGSFFLNMGRYYYLGTSLSKALDYGKKSIDSYNRTGDSLNNDFGQAYYLLSTISNINGNFLGCLNYSEKAIQLFEIQKDTLSLLWTKMTLEIMFSNNLLEKEAETIRNENRRVATNIGAHEILANSLVTEYILLRKRGDIELGTQKLKKALETTKLVNSFQGGIMHFMVSCLIVLNSSTLGLKNEADSYMKIVESNLPKYKNLPMMNSYYQVANAYYLFMNNQLSLCEEINLENIRNFEKNPENEGHILAIELMVKLYKKIGNTSEEYKYYIQLSQLKEKIYNTTKNNQWLYFHEQFKSLEKDRKIAEQKQRVEKLIEKQKNRIKTIFLGLIILLLAAGVLYLGKTRKLALERQIEQNEFARQLIIAQRGQKKRISKEVHDGLGQNLILIQNQLMDTSSKELVQETLAMVRNLTQNLHPFVLERFGFIEAIKQLADRVDKSTDFFIIQEIHEGFIQLPEEKALNIYRMMQEALSNAIKYSQSDVIKIVVNKTSQYLFCQVQDYGLGFDIDKANRKKSGLGLKMIEERSAAVGVKFFLKSNLGEGSIYTFKLKI